MTETFQLPNGQSEAESDASIERWERITAAFDGAGQPLSQDEEEDFNGALGWTPDTIGRLTLRLAAVRDASARDCIITAFLDYFRGEGWEQGAEALIAFESGASAVNTISGKTRPIEPPAAPQTVAPDTIMQGFIDSASKHSKAASLSRTEHYLGMMDDVAKGVAHQIVQSCPSHGDVKTWRHQAIGLFSGPVSFTSGEPLTQKRLTEFLDVFYLTTLLDHGAKSVVNEVNWEHLRTLARWVIYQPGAALFEKKSIYEESWTIKTGCEAKLNELVVSLAKSPMTRTTLIETLNKHELAISGKPKPIPEKRDVVKARNTYIDSVADKVQGEKSTVRMTPEIFAAKLEERGLIPPRHVVLDEVDFKTMTLEQANQLAADLIASGNLAAIVAIVARLKAVIAVANGAAQPSKAVGASVDALQGMSREIRKSA